MTGDETHVCWSGVEGNGGAQPGNRDTGKHQAGSRGDGERGHTRENSEQLKSSGQQGLKEVGDLFKGRWQKHFLCSKGPRLSRSGRKDAFSGPELQSSSQAHKQDWENARSQAMSWCLCNDLLTLVFSCSVLVSSGSSLGEAGGLRREGGMEEYSPCCCFPCFPLLLDVWL